MPVPEGDILKPAALSISDSNKWEEFTLNNAHVVYESNGKPASLLLAYPDTPLKVVGTFAPSRGQSKYLLDKPTKPLEIVIQHVTRFSYAELEDGGIVIWAAGRAGWFEIHPALHYAEIFETIEEAVRLLYFVTDIHNGPRKKGSGPSPQLIFQEYAEDERFTCTDPAVAAEIFRKHHVFLMMCFLNREHGISWSNTPLYQYFRRQYPKDFEICKARIEGRSAQVLPERPTRTSKSSPARATTSVASTKPTRGSTSVVKTNEAPKKDNNWWEAATLFEFMQKAVNQRVVRAGRHQITLERVAQLIVRRYEIEEAETAQNVLLVHAQNICYMMDHPRRKNVRFFADEPIYRELAAGHKLSAAEQRRAEGTQLRPRKDHATLKDTDAQSSDTSSEDEDVIATPVRSPPGRRKKGRLSVLRPTSSKFSGKSKGIKHATQGGGSGKAPAPVSHSSTTSESDEDEQGSDSDDDMAINTPTQAASPGREKRKLDETDTDEQEEKTRRKRAASASISPDAPSPVTETEDEEGQVLADPPLPLRYRPLAQTSSSRLGSSHTKVSLAPSLVATPLPTYEANGPRDSWICQFDGCSQHVYKCSREIGRQLITEHLEDHAKGREKVVGILWREQDKLQLPVSNLIKRIRDMSEATTPLFPMPDTERVQPRPIQRSV
ncbi:hypothetical protein DE146DRAFT_218318 [Phaeosphaeria sp. MPI-PUGE-AT-0046c]|nr:hypothetical protein DE146DRAFT_218318 [Phaeosphaeria sp. MPI-PUGE-AT-0046c]